MPDAPADATSTETPKPSKPPMTFGQKLWHEWVKPLGTILLVLIVVRSSLVDWNDVPSGSMNPTILEGDRIVVNKLAYGINFPVNGPVVDLPFLPTFNNPLSFLPRYLWSAPERGDIVTFWNPTPPTLKDGSTNPSHGIRMVKRVVGLPGDTIEVIDGRLRIIDQEGNTVVTPDDYQPVATGIFTTQASSAWRPVMREVEGQMRAVPDFTPPNKPVMLPVKFLIESLGDREHATQFLQPVEPWTPSGHQYRNLDPLKLKNEPGLAEDEYFMVGDNRDNSSDSRYYYASLNGLTVKGKHITGKAKFIALSFDGSFLAPRFHRLFRGFDQPTVKDLREGVPIR